MFKLFMKELLRLLFRVEVDGIQHFQNTQGRVLIVANHASFLDPVLLWAFLPGTLTFAINTRIAQLAWVRPFLRLARVFPLDPSNTSSLKALIKHLRQGERTVIFPEGRITVTGTLMKVYDGAGMVADKAGAVVLPVRIEGAQYTVFSKLKGRVRRRLLPKIALHVLPPTDIRPPPELKGAERRKQAGLKLADLMTEMLFLTCNTHKTLFSALLDARRLHGRRKKILEDVTRQPLHYQGLITRIVLMTKILEGNIPAGSTVGLLLPGSANTVALLFAVQISGRIPAMLNYTGGVKGVASACATAEITTVITSRKFVSMAQLENVIACLRQQGVEICFLEEEAAKFTFADKLWGYFRALGAGFWYRSAPEEWNQPAVMLFTSGSEGTPKGVLLSHGNLLANGAQLGAVIDFNQRDVILNVLPLFHVFGLSAGLLLPLTTGMFTFLYPNPLHYKVVPEIAYDLNATVMFGTNTFLYQYGKQAHPYDFYSIRYVFAGAEKLQEEVRRLWMDKFGIRILEGYGTTETSPVLAVNTPMYYRAGTVGRFLPGIERILQPVSGIPEGGRLFVKGPNIMLGYVLSEQPGKLVPTRSELGEGWYDTGDIVVIDDDGFATIQGRAKRFAKVAGEMVSLVVVEELACKAWPDCHHAAVTLPDAGKGEQIILVTEFAGAQLDELRRMAQREGVPELWLPKRIIGLQSLPLLGSGKIDYGHLQTQVESRLMEAS